MLLAIVSNLLRVGEFATKFTSVVAGCWPEASISFYVSLLKAASFFLKIERETQREIQRDRDREKEQDREGEGSHDENHSYF